MFTHLPSGRVAVLDGGRSELAQRLLGGDIDLGAPAAMVLREPDGYYVVEYDQLEELRRLWDQRVRLDTVPDGTERVLELLEGELDLPAGPAAVVAPGEEPPSSAVVLDGGAVEGVWVAPAAGMETFGIGQQKGAISNVANDARIESANGGGVDTGADQVIRRTPHMRARDRLPVALGSRFPVTVWTDTAPARDDEESEHVVIEMPPDVDAVDLGVLLKTSPHFRAVGGYFDMLHVERDRADSQPLRFTVEVVAPDEPGPAAVEATLLWQGRECGHVKRRWSWPEGRTLAGAPAPAAQLTAGVRRPDMSVLISSPTNDERQQWSICAPGVPGYEDWTEPQDWSSGAGSSAYIAQKLDRFVDRTIDPGERRGELRKAGRDFWKAAPPVFHDALWALIDARAGATGRASLYVATDDPLLPWELMMPTRELPDGAPEDRPRPLGVEFALGRRLRGERRPPPELLPVRESILIAARYGSPERELAPDAELDVLARHYGGRRLEHASRQYFDAHLASAGASLVHFVCHGQATSDSATLYLDDDEQYTSGDVRDSVGFKALCAAHHPIVFLNACDAGQTRLTIGPGGAGFPQAFTELGARAVIAPLWPVTKYNAPKVATELYTRAAASPERPLADILAELREASYAGADADFDDTWAAYCFYGDPCAPLRRTG